MFQVEYFQYFHFVFVFVIITVRLDCKLIEREFARDMIGSQNPPNHERSERHFLAIFLRKQTKIDMNSKQQRLVHVLSRLFLI